MIITAPKAAMATPCTQCQGGDQRALERTRFFSRQIVTPDDLTQDQLYFREKAKRHNRMLHGWGIVCGAMVRGGKGCEVVIEPGYILGPHGDEIVIDKETVVDVCKLGAGEQDGCCGEELDPWCSDVRADCAAGTLYLAVKYSECQTRPVRGGGGCGCGCSEGDCEYSRIRDSFTVKLLRELPAGYSTPMKQLIPSALDPCRRAKAALHCPPCPADPWVVLADVIVGADCKVRSVDNATHRRYVVSFGDYYMVCADQAKTGKEYAEVAGSSMDIASLRDTIDPSALASLESGEATATLPATALAGVSERSALGKRLASLTVGGVGAMTREAFVAHATKGVAASQRKRTTQQAEEVWQRAQRATSAYAPEPDEGEE